MEIYERLDDLDADKALVRAGKILFGLGFSKQMQHTAVKNFSGNAQIPNFSCKFTWRYNVVVKIKPGMLSVEMTYGEIYQE